MSSVKERIIGAVTIMNEKDAEKIWEIIQSTFILSQAETTVPNADELAALSAKNKEILIIVRHLRRKRY